MSSVLVTGAARGLGLGLVQLLASKPTSEINLIFASARKPNEALTKLAAAHPGRVHVIALEVSDVASVQKAAKQVETVLDEHKATLDVLVNNAGVLNTSPDGVQTMTGLDLEETFRINVVGTHIVTTEFLPLLKKGTGKKIISISSPLASLTLAPHLTMFRSPAYKISKTAVNMLTVQWANDFGKEGFTFLALSPGWVKTDMGSDEAELTVEQSVNGILRVIKQSDSSSNGKFFDVEVEGWKPTPISAYQGGEIAW
ncbi:short-chain dehydrogenase-like protein [Flagelloscypha sp. PMI_526]|nr:short-chain dehydrogenase-like protein [Flagelloscypha sp. PMI_526]